LSTERHCRDREMGSRTTKCDPRNGDAVGGAGQIKKNVESRLETNLEIEAATSNA
jgi:hypothetical protein